MKIEILTTKVPLDPPITIYEVVVTNETGEWREAFGSRELVDAFLRGVRAEAATLGDLSVDTLVEPTEKVWRIPG